MPKSVFRQLVPLLCCLALCVRKSESALNYKSDDEYYNANKANADSNTELLRMQYGENINLTDAQLFEQSLSEDEAREIHELHHDLANIFASVKFWREIYIVSGMCLTVAGTTLNLLCILIFSKSKLFRNSSFPYYVYVISVVDTLNIFMRYLVPQTMEIYVRHALVTQYNIVPNEVDQEKYDHYTSLISSDMHCSVFLYVYNCLTLISVWLMAAVSLERWLVIKYTLQTRQMIRMRAISILAFIFVSIFGLNVFDLAPGF